MSFAMRSCNAFPFSARSDAETSDNRRSSDGTKRLGKDGEAGGGMATLLGTRGRTATEAALGLFEGIADGIPTPMLKALEVEAAFGVAYGETDAIRLGEPCPSDGDDIRLESVGLSAPEGSY